MTETDISYEPGPSGIVQFITNFDLDKAHDRDTYIDLVTLVLFKSVKSAEEPISDTLTNPQGPKMVAIPTRSNPDPYLKKYR